MTEVKNNTYTLSIDTSGPHLNVGLYLDENTGFAYNNSSEEIKSHSIEILSVIDDLMKQADIEYKDIKDITLTKGPGSFTGLRIGATVSKILADQLNAKLHPVSTLEATYLSQTCPSDQLVIPVIDARNENVFAGGYQNGHNVLEDGHYAISYLKEKYPKAIYLVAKSAVDKMDFEYFEEIDDRKLINPLILAKVGLTKPSEDASDFTPSYLRKTQAEMNWQKEHNEIQTDGVFLVD